MLGSATATPLPDSGKKWIARTCAEGISPHEMFDVVLRPGRSSFMPQMSVGQVLDQDG
jgi:hypothetical protein